MEREQKRRGTQEMQWWGYLILGFGTLVWVWILAMINKDDDDLIDRGKK